MRCCPNWRHGSRSPCPAQSTWRHAEFDLAIIGAFCGSHTLRGLLERLSEDDAERAVASIPFLLTVRWLQDALFDIARGDEPELRRLHEHLDERRR